MIWQDLCWNGNPLAFNFAHLSRGSNHNGDEDDGYCDDADGVTYYDDDGHACDDYDGHVMHGMAWMWSFSELFPFVKLVWLLLVFVTISQTLKHQFPCEFVSVLNLSNFEIIIISLWTNLIASCTHFIFVTTITTAGCVKNSVKCKIFQWIRERDWFNIAQNV